VLFAAEFCGPERQISLDASGSIQLGKARFEFLREKEGMTSKSECHDPYGALGITGPTPMIPGRPSSHTVPMHARPAHWSPGPGVAVTILLQGRLCWR